MSAEAINPLFADESTALQTLGSNFERLAYSIERIARSPIFKHSKPKCVAELGGGTGIIGMWLVANGLCQSCEIYDHANSPLIIGESWAKKLNLLGITFHHKSYAELGKTNNKSYDFVFAEHAVSLDYMEPMSSTLDRILAPEHCPFLDQYRELATAINSLLKPKGTGLIGSGVVTPTCAAALCSSLREQRLAINWNESSNHDGLQLFVQPEGVMLFETIVDETLAIMSDVSEKRETPKRDVLSLEKIFMSGRKYFDVSSEDAEMQYRCTIIQFAGLVGLFQSTSKGFRTAKLYSAGKVPQLARSILEDARKRRILDQYIDSRLASILEEF